MVKKWIPDKNGDWVFPNVLHSCGWTNSQKLWVTLQWEEHCWDYWPQKEKFQNFQLLVTLGCFLSLGNVLLPALKAISKEKRRKKRRCHFGRCHCFILPIATWGTCSNFFARKFFSKHPVLLDMETGRLPRVSLTNPSPDSSSLM